MTAFAADGTAGTFDGRPGAVGFVPRNMGHSIEDTGTTILRSLDPWRAEKFAAVSLRQLLASTPFDLVRARLHIDRSVPSSIPAHKPPVVPA